MAIWQSSTRAGRCRVPWWGSPGPRSRGSAPHPWKRASVHHSRRRACPSTSDDPRTFARAALADAWPHLYGRIAELVHEEQTALAEREHTDLGIDQVAEAAEHDAVMTYAKRLPSWGCALPRHHLR